MKRLAKMLFGAILAAFALVIPVAPANADDDYMVELNIDDDLNVREIVKVTLPEESYELLGNLDFCEQLESLAKVRLADTPGIRNPELGNCEQHENNISFEITGQVKEDYTSGEGWKVTDDEIVYSLPREVGMFSGLIDGAEGGVKITLPGRIKSVEPDIGSFSGNTWSIDNASSIDNRVTITAERHGSLLGTSEGSMVGVALIAVAALAVIVVLIVMNNRKKASRVPKLAMNEHYGYMPPPTNQNSFATPEKSINTPQSQPSPPKSQSPTPGAAGFSPRPPAMPKAPEMPTGFPVMPIPPQPPLPKTSPQGGYPPQYGYFPPAPYPPSTPQGQPGVPAPGGYYPYPYPPTATQNPQNPAGGQPSMPNQGYNSPTPGFPVPQAPSQPTPAGATAAPEPPEQANRGKHRANTPPPNHSADPGSLK